jgi:hypothetical protein
LERHEQVALARYLDMAVGEYGWAHSPNEGRRSWRMGASLKAQGLKAGLPDVLIFARPPRRSNAVSCDSVRGVAIELKRVGARDSDVSADQVAWLRELGRQGWVCRWCAGADEAIKWLKSLGYP